MKYLFYFLIIKKELKFHLNLVYILFHLICNKILKNDISSKDTKIISEKINIDDYNLNFPDEKIIIDDCNRTKINENPLASLPVSFPRYLEKIHCYSIEQPHKYI